MKEILRHAGKNDPAYCPKGCGRMYRGKDRKHSLRRHLIYECGVEPQFMCTVCQKQLTTKHSLKYHLATIHSKIIK